MWQFLSKPGARLLKDLQLVGLLYAISFAQSEDSWPSKPIRLYCRTKAKDISDILEQNKALVAQCGNSCLSQEQDC